MGIDVISPSPNKNGYWVVFAEDINLEEFKRKLTEYVQKDNTYNFFNAIDGISDIPPDEKIGPYLTSEPIGDTESAILDISIWRMDDAKLNSFLIGLASIIYERSSEILDMFKTNNFCLLKVIIRKSLFLEILNMREIEHIDRPPKSKIEELISTDFSDLIIDGAPNRNATGILIVDSGILSNHPLFGTAIGDEIAISTADGSIQEDSPADDVGHGTQVAGIALYGDIKKCIENGVFKPQLWIFSAKVMFRDENGYATYGETILLEHQIDKAVRSIVVSYPNCKIINLSLGNTRERMSVGQRQQYNIASLIDDLIKELNVIFVISTGNFDDRDVNDNYPDYLLDETSDRVKITDIASSALAITVGATYNQNLTNTILGVDTIGYFPSPLTRVGLGYKGMIKPEFVENGGGGFDDTNDVITLNPSSDNRTRLFTLSCGTSLSTPKVAYDIGMLINSHPDWSNNLIKALLLSSSEIPNERPTNLNMNIYDSETSASNILKIYGYGIPDVDKALFSEGNRVVLIHQNAIKLNHIHLYSIYLPDNLFSEKGIKKISVTLVYNPPTSKKRNDYLGVTFETHLFKNKTPEELSQGYSRIQPEHADENIVPPNLKNSEIHLHPGTKLRKKGVHQKGMVEYKSKPNINIDYPLVLAVICQDRWVKDDSYLQDYSVIVTIEHSANIDIYNQIRLRNRVEVRERVEISLGR